MKITTWLALPCRVTVNGVLETSRQTLLLAMLVLGPITAMGAERYALVIGNGAYEYIDALGNPPNDVRLVAERLRGVGFEVALIVNGNKRQMDDAARQFARQLDDAGRNAVGLFYFAGHGVAYQGENWLIPVSANIREAVDIEYETLSANKILGLMESARNATDIVILDACRNSPFRSFSLSGTRAISVGMRRMDAPAGSFIAYSTAPGQVAYDGAGDYSPFAEAFAAEINAPGLSISDMMIEVRRRVKETTEGLGNEPQTPWDASSLTGRFSFNPGSAARQGSGNPAPVPAGPPIKVMTQPNDAATSAVDGGAEFSVTPEQFRGFVSNDTDVFEKPDRLSQRYRRLAVGDVIRVTGRVDNRLWYQVELEGGLTGYASMPAIQRL